jgi:hypothetical protein
MGTWGFSSGVKLPEREADHSLPSSAKLKNDHDIPPLFHTLSNYDICFIRYRETITFSAPYVHLLRTSSWYSAYLVKHRDKFTLLFRTKSTWSAVNFVCDNYVSTIKLLHFDRKQKNMRKGRIFGIFLSKEFYLLRHNYITIAEDRTLHNHHWENLKFCVFISSFFTDAFQYLFTYLCSNLKIILQKILTW